MIEHIHLQEVVMLEHKARVLPNDHKRKQQHTSGDERVRRGVSTSVNACFDTELRSA